MTTAKYDSRHIITTNDHRFFVGNNENDALYELLLARGLKTKTVTVIPSIEASGVIRLSNLYPQPDFLIGDIPSQSAHFGIGYVQRSDSYTLTHISMQEEAWEAVPEEMAIAVPRDTHHVTHHVTSIGMRGNGLNPYNSIQVKDKEGRTILVYTGCLRENPLGIKNEYDFFTVSIENEEQKLDYALLANAGRFVKREQMAGFGNELLSLDAVALSQSNPAEIREHLKNVMSLLKYNYVREITGYHGMTFPFANFFFPDEIFANMFHQVNRARGDVHPFYFFLDNEASSSEETTLVNALESIDMNPARIVGILLGTYVNSPDLIAVDFQAYHRNQSKPTLEKTIEER